MALSKSGSSLLLSIILVCSVLFSACSSSKASEGQLEVVRIGYQKGNTLNILKVKGNLDERLKKQGIKIEWNVFPSGGTVLEALAAGKIDYGNAADGSGVFAQASGQSFVYVGSDLPNPEGMGIMVHKDSGIAGIGDLKGKKVAVVKGGNHHYLTVLALESSGLQYDDVEYVYVKDASEGRALFETKQVDALGSWDPFFATVQMDLQPVTLTDGSHYSPNRTFYYATKEFAEAHPEIVKAILEETDVSDQWANENKGEVVKMLAGELGIDEESLAKMVGRRTYGVEAIKKEIIAPQQQLADTFHKIGLIEHSIDVSSYMPVGKEWVPDLK
ncbi:sulfonate ABC transporter substrate-binding protein [Paenibacillus sp. SAFN-117]|uniref:sulfonate ABC transporter substrate-binding protein n=1 Tax=Paenibacillus sp. SAFN-117 TaxID=3436860 RepID=UPI003F815BFC